MNENQFVPDSQFSLYQTSYCDVQMDELGLEKAYSIEYYKRLFYPEIPCKQCENCWRKGYWNIPVFPIVQLETKLNTKVGLNTHHKLFDQFQA